MLKRKQYFSLTYFKCQITDIDIAKLSSIKNPGQDYLSQATKSQAHYALDIPDAHKYFDPK